MNSSGLAIFERGSLIFRCRITDLAIDFGDAGSKVWVGMQTSLV
jgi:hypothetical protein